MDSYRKRRGEHLLRMDGSRMPKIAFEYNPKRRRDVERPRKDGRCKFGTGQGPNPWKDNDDYDESGDNDDDD